MNGRPPGAEQLRVVIVDDSEQIRSLLATLLNGACAVAGMASDGDDAVELIAAEQPDVVIMDLHMPRCDGLTAIRDLRPRCPATTFVMFTSGDAAGIEACLAEGAERHFPKQDIAELVAYVCSLRPASPVVARRSRR